MSVSVNSTVSQGAQMNTVSECIRGWCWTRGCTFSSHPLVWLDGVIHSPEGLDRMKGAHHIVYYHITWFRDIPFILLLCIGIQTINSFGSETSWLNWSTPPAFLSLHGERGEGRRGERVQLGVQLAVWLTKLLACFSEHLPHRLSISFWATTIWRPLFKNSRSSQSLSC